MKYEDKKTIIILVLFAVIVVAAICIIVQKLEDGSKLNVSDELRKTKNVEGLEISNIQLKEIGGITTLLADVENKTGKATERKMVKIDILDNSGNVITDVQGVMDPMKAGEKVQLNTAVSADVANAYDFRINGK